MSGSEVVEGIGRAHLIGTALQAWANYLETGWAEYTKEEANAREIACRRSAPDEEARALIGRLRTTSLEFFDIVSYLQRRNQELGT